MEKAITYASTDEVFEVDSSSPHRDSELLANFRRQNSSISNISGQSNDSYNSSDVEFLTYFMKIAVMIAKRRKSTKHQAGACIVSNTNKIIATGNYSENSTKMPSFLSWFKDGSKAKHDYLNHAEINAIFNKGDACLENSTLFVTVFPCLECAKLIVQSSIKKVVYLDYPEFTCQRQTPEEIEETKLLFNLSNVALIKLD